jgi:hypothetical protein
MVISQADRKIHEEFSEKINKILPNKRKKIKNFFFCGRVGYWINRYFNELNIKEVIIGKIIIHFLIIYGSPFRFWILRSGTENYQK